MVAVGAVVVVTPILTLQLVEQFDLSEERIVRKSIQWITSSHEQCLGEE